MGSIQLRDMNRDDRLAAINAQIASYPGVENKIAIIGEIGDWEKGDPRSRPDRNHRGKGVARDVSALACAPRQ